MSERGPVYTLGRDTTDRRRSEGELRTNQRERGALPAEQAAVGREVGEALNTDATHIRRYEADDSVVSIAQWGLGCAQVSAGGDGRS